MVWSHYCWDSSCKDSRGNTTLCSSACEKLKPEQQFRPAPPAPTISDALPALRKASGIQSFLFRAMFLSQFQILSRKLLRLWTAQIQGVAKWVAAKNLRPLFVLYPIEFFNLTEILNINITILRNHYINNNKNIKSVMLEAKMNYHSIFLIKWY